MNRVNGVGVESERKALTPREPFCVQQWRGRTGISVTDPFHTCTLACRFDRVAENTFACRTSGCFHTCHADENCHLAIVNDESQLLCMYSKVVIRAMLSDGMWGTGSWRPGDLLDLRHRASMFNKDRAKGVGKAKRGAERRSASLEAIVYRIVDSVVPGSDMYNKVMLKRTTSLLGIAAKPGGDDALVCAARKHAIENKIEGLVMIAHASNEQRDFVVRDITRKIVALWNKVNPNGKVTEKTVTEHTHLMITYLKGSLCVHGVPVITAQEGCRALLSVEDIRTVSSSLSKQSKVTARTSPTPVCTRGGLGRRSSGAAARKKGGGVRLVSYPRIFLDRVTQLMNAGVEMPLV